MKYLRRFLDFSFYIIHPLFKSPSLQRFLVRYIALPYSMAKHLNYTELVKFCVNKTSLVMRSYNTPIEITIFWRGLLKAREGCELHLWSKLVQDADVILDVGANNGLYALIGASNKGVKVYAFEPVPVVYDMLKENIKLNQVNNIIPIKEVVSDKNGETILFVPKTGWVDVASLKKEFAEKFIDENRLEEIKCKSTTIDDFLSKEQVNLPDKIVCKIDVEGAEYRVVQGMVSSLRVRNVVLLAELLTEKDFNQVRGIIPSEYKTFAVNLVNRELELCNSYTNQAKNFMFAKVDYPNVLDGLKL